MSNALNGTALVPYELKVNSGAESTENPDFDPFDLLKDFPEVHPALDFTPDGIVLGFSSRRPGIDGPETVRRLLTGKNGNFRLSLADANVIWVGSNEYMVSKKGTPPRLTERWSLEYLKSFYRNPSCPDHLLQSIAEVLEEYLDFSDPAYYTLTAAWITATYFSPLFSAFPFLFFFGPKESGKSNALELLSFLCFNGRKIKNVTEPALAEQIDNKRGTVLLDQAESLPKKMVGLLADSYKRHGAIRQIIRIVNKERVVVEYSAYGPKGFAATTPLDLDLIDRCIVIPMQKTHKPLPNAMGDEDIFLAIRDHLYRFQLTRWPDVKNAYRDIPGDRGRPTELWKPIGAVLKVANVETDQIKRVRALFDARVEAFRNKLSDEEAALLQVLVARARKKSTFELAPKDILSDLRSYLDVQALKALKPQWVGRKIALFDLASTAKKRTRAREKYYTFSDNRVLGVAGRYLSPEEMRG